MAARCWAQNPALRPVFPSLVTQLEKIAISIDLDAMPSFPHVIGSQRPSLDAPYVFTTPSSLDYHARNAIEVVYIEV